MFTVGMAVHASDGSFSGTLLGDHGRQTGSPAGKYWSSGSELNLTIYAVEHPVTHEVRFFTHAGLVEGKLDPAPVPAPPLPQGIARDPEDWNPLTVGF